MPVSEYDRYASWRQGLGIDDVAWARLVRYQQLLQSAAINVTALRGVSLWEKGILDSLAVLKIEDSWSRAIDIGSGGGFPGLVLAMVRDQRSVTLVESRLRRAELLEQMTTKLELRNVTVVQSRAEDFLREESDHREEFDLATIRAVGSFRMSVELAVPALRIGGIAVLLRGRQAAEEARAQQEFVQLLGGTTERVESVQLPSFAEPRFLVVVRKRIASPNDYPRMRHLGN